MTRWHRLGILPYLVIAAALVVGGLLWLERLVNNVWPIDLDLPAAQIAELQRSVVMQRGQATLIMQASNGEAIVAFIAGVIAVGMGVVLPLVYLVNKRLNRPRRGDPVRPLAAIVLLRQGLWFGGWLGFCVWLQMNRTLSIVVAGLVALLFILLEVLLQVRARQQSEPEPTPVRPIRVPTREQAGE